MFVNTKQKVKKEGQKILLFLLIFPLDVISQLAYNARFYHLRHPHHQRRIYMRTL